MSSAESEMNSSTISAIERILALVDAANIDELRRFLATQKGFRPVRRDLHKSAIHYVSEKRFETEKEADEWLRYLVVEKNQSVDQKEVFNERSPLHYACAEGNIFGVKWLISHGANVNVKDVAQHTPYLYACASSIDAMEKMLVLEENDIDLSSFSICWAAEARFSSYEQAHEIFCHLIEKKGMSIDARTIYVGGATTQMMGDTALHCACELGSIFGVKWLFEHRPSLLDSVNDGGCTPFMLACRSPYDRSLKVRYLSKKGANCLAQDYLGRVALFDAVQEGIKTFSQAVSNKRSCLLDALQEGRQALREVLTSRTREIPTWYVEAIRDFVTSDDKEVKDVIQYLVMEKQIDVNSVDRMKGTPVLHACYLCTSLVVIQQLMELGANILARDNDGQNALHIAGIDVSPTTVEFLIENGVDVTCKDKYGKLPYQVANYGEVRMLLQQHYDTLVSVLQQEKNSSRLDAWFQESTFDVYRGQRCECAQLFVDAISSPSFIVFQTQCARMANTSHKAWKHGVELVKIVDDKVVECLVELGVKRGRCCIDIVLRWSSQKARCHEVAKEFLAELKKMIVRVCDERKPGVALNWYYLDSKHLRQRDEDPATYSMSDVERKVTEKAFNDNLFSVRPEKRFYSSVRDLVVIEVSPEEAAVSHREETLFSPSAVTKRNDKSPLEDASASVEQATAPSTKSTFPADEDFVPVQLIKACATFNGLKWEEIGVLLISSNDLDEIRKASDKNLVRMFKVLESWNTAKSPTVGQLLMWFEEVGVNRCHIKRKYDELPK